MSSAFTSWLTGAFDSSRQRAGASKSVLFWRENETAFVILLRVFPVDKERARVNQCYFGGKMRWPLSFTTSFSNRQGARASESCYFGGKTRWPLSFYYKLFVVRTA